jgi:DNA polymerase II large subunit
MREADERYFRRLENQLDEAMAVASDARSRGGDPTDEVEIPIAKDMADRVENILGIPGVAERVRDMEEDPSLSREEAALELATDFANGEVGDYDTRAGKVEGAVRTAVALLTEGVVAAPIEGIDRVEILENDDGTEFVRVFYAGPIRSAGGTAQALSVLVADYTRTLVGIDRYKPRDDEVERYVEELGLYDSETGLQYTPKDKETRFITQNVPIMLDGEATGDEEVDGYRDLERLDTNAARGGMCLVLGEGLAQKAPKIKRYTSQLDEVDWPWLDDLIDGTIGNDEGNEEPTADEPASGAVVAEAEAVPTAGGPTGPKRAEPATKFLRDLIAGRPVFGHPSRPGGFRLRYGRSRNHGFATAGVHPATMHLVDDFLATGTQIKTERPGKAAGVVPVDSIEGPTVKLATGEVRRIDDPEEAVRVRNGVDAILDLGEYLINFGEFVENNHSLSPASYTPDWWIQDLEHAGVDVQAFADDPRVDLEAPPADRALTWATSEDCPLHPKYTYLWHDLPVERFDQLADVVSAGHWAEADGMALASDESSESHQEPESPTIVLPRTEFVTNVLELLLVEHTQGEETVTVPDAKPFVLSLGLTETLDRTWELTDLSAEARQWGSATAGENAVRAVNEVAPFEIRERAPTRIGARMGRPEKSEKRDLSPAVHTLFPIGEAGGSQRDVGAAADWMADRHAKAGEVEVQVSRRVCSECNTHTFRARCPDCDAVTMPRYACRDCGTPAVPDANGRAICPRCESNATPVEYRSLDIKHEYRAATESVGERETAFGTLKGVKGLTSAEKIPEPMEKGILRAKNGVSTFKDGTVRYDMTDLPVTSVRPTELDLTAEDFRELGYHEDIDGQPLTHDDQLVELKVQDIVLSDGAAEHMMRTADFVDDLLEQYYGMERFYEIDEREELVGELVFGMAPHTSAAVVGRVVGFTSAAVGYAHPYFHAAKRRNCFHPETKLWYETPDGETRHEPFETFVEQYLDEERAEIDDFGTLVDQLDNLDGTLRVPSLADDGSQSLRPVEALSRHPAPDHLVHVQTRSGRELTVTPDHRVHVYDATLGRIVSKEAKDLDESDQLVSPRHLDSLRPSETGRRFDLLAEFVASDNVENDRLMIKGLTTNDLYDLFTERLATEWDERFSPLQSTAEHLGLTKKALSNYLNRQSVPVSLLAEFFDSTERLLAWVPGDVTLGMKHDRTEIDRFVELNERVATLLGYYAAKGFSRQQETLNGIVHQTTICGTEDETRQFFVETLREEFGVDPYEETHVNVTVSGRLLRTFLDTVLNAGIYAHTKRVPQCVFDAPDELVGAYLSGYFSGNGIVSEGSLHVGATTVSSELRYDLMALLTRLDIDASVNHHDSVSSPWKFSDYYDIDTKSMSAPCYVLSLSSTASVRFAERIGFHLPYKQETLATSVDESSPCGTRVSDGGNNEYLIEAVESKEYVAPDIEYVYCLEVEKTHSLIAGDMSVKQCDGDEDCVMLLMDGLLNFSKKFLPDQRGGSVAEDSRLVASGPAGEMRFMTFDQLWEELDSPVEHDGKFHKRTCAVEGWRTYAFDDKHNAALRPIEKAIRYQADDDETLLRVSTQFGRSVDITTEHSLFRYDDGIEEVAGDDLEIGDLLVAPRELPVETEQTTIDVAELVDDPHVLVDRQLKDLLQTVRASTDGGTDPGITLNADVAHQLSPGKIPYERLEGLLSRGGFSVPETCSVVQPDSTDGIQRYIELDERAGWVLGLLAAEGDTSRDRPTISFDDETLLKRTVSTVGEWLDVEPNISRSDQASHLALPSVFHEIVCEMGLIANNSHNSAEKHVPDAILRAPDAVALSFLRGFLAGNGNKHDDRDAISAAFHTTSEAVKDGLVLLLHRFGIVATVSHREQDSSQPPSFTVSSSNSARTDPLSQILTGENFDHSEELIVGVPDALMAIREMNITGVRRIVLESLKHQKNVSLATLAKMIEQIDQQEIPPEAESKLAALRPLIDGDLSYLQVTDIESVDYNGYLYDLQVGGDPVFTTNWLYAHNSMDAPLVMSSRIDPTEIDDEAHNMDIVESYPREFYLKTLEMADPGDANITIAEEYLGTDREYSGFRHTHDTTDIALGPDLSAYKTLDDMQKKMNGQLQLARKLAGVDETDVAERIIEYHFLPDLIGNLRAFSRQKTRCLDCGEDYRRMPLTGDCRECGGRVNLTVHKGSVNKYMETAQTVAEEFDCRPYTKQRLKILKQSLESVFEDDTNRQSGIADFM